MELRRYVQAVKAINNHIADKQSERDELIEQAKKEHNLTAVEFNNKYSELYEERD